MLESFRGFAAQATNLVIVSAIPSYHYGIVGMMSATSPPSGTAQLTPTSYLVLGLIAREGPSTPYDLKRHVTATIGHFWSFPHALLYKEPPRLKSLGLLTEERESGGRRRRLFTITPAGRRALRSWLGHPARQPTELRDLGLLQLFFADLEPAGTMLAIAKEQLALHRAQLAEYAAGRRVQATSEGRGTVSPSVEHWRGVTLRMGLLYERAAVEFWSDLAGRMPKAGSAATRPRAKAGPGRALRTGPR
jgi:DNA-binding PadR family transcriptional regulator